MKRICGYTLFFVGIGMLLAFFIPNDVVRLLLTAAFLILGYFLFGDIPDGWSFLGYFIIIAMAVLVFLYNNVWHNDSEVKG